MARWGKKRAEKSATRTELRTNTDETLQQINAARSAIDGGLGTAAYQNTGTSGTTIPFCDGANTWGGKQTHALPVILPTYTVAGVPSAATYPRGLIYVSDEVGGAVVAFSDGTNWLRVTDRAIIS